MSDKSKALTQRTYVSALVVLLVLLVFRALVADALGAGGFDRLVDLEGASAVVAQTPNKKADRTGPLDDQSHSMKNCKGARGCSGRLSPDPLQRLAELARVQRCRRVSSSQDAADPPDLQTPKDKGDKTQLDVSPVQVFLHTVCSSLCQVRSSNCRKRSVCDGTPSRCLRNSDVMCQNLTTATTAKTAQGASIQRGLSITLF